MKLAVLSDTHGNLQGLQAVLEDIQRRQADVVWCGGDLVGYGANPGEVVETLQHLGIPTVMGNYDDGVGYYRIRCDYPSEEAMQHGLGSIAWTKENTTEAHKSYLRSLPYRIERDFEGSHVVLVHASPARLNEYLYEDVADSIFQEHLDATGADVLIFGHTHRPYHRTLGIKHLINSGSAGKPKHGNPRATYIMIEFKPRLVQPQIIEVPYDHETAARAVESADLPNEFAEMLRQGLG